MFLYKRGKIYQLEYFDEELGNTKRITTGCQSKIAATKFVSTFLKNQQSKKIKVIKLLQDFKREYLIFVEQTYSAAYINSIHLSFRLFEQYFGNPSIQSLKSREIEKYLLLVHQRAKYSSSLYLRTLKAAFNKAIEWDYIEENPFVKIKLPKNIIRIPQTISKKELESITCATKNPMLREVFIAAFYTGMRQGELINLQWSAVDLKRKIITAKNSSDFKTKNKKERMIPMNKLVLQRIKTLQGSEYSNFVFSNDDNYKFRGDYVSHKFKQAVRISGLCDSIHFHTLRLSFASNLVRKGVSLYVVKELLGHESISTTQIYAHLDNSALVSAVDLLY